MYFLKENSLKNILTLTETVVTLSNFMKDFIPLNYLTV